MIKGIDHIGIAVHSIEYVRPFYEQTLNLPLLGIEYVEDQQVKVAFFQCGDVKLELLEPTSDSSPIQQFLNKRGEGLHHVAFGTQTIDQRITQLKRKGIRMIDETPRIGAGGAQIAFLHPSSSAGVLYELCEK
ncbi:methylmalonyl-CoA epimerase [Priestia megaterium]|nr:methylmalonyl-CoA epimerase [Priestia megaterium]